MNFSKKQLEFMAYVQGEDDWHPNYFIDVLKETQEKDTNIPEDVKIGNVEFQELIGILRKLHSDSIQDLQLALDLLRQVEQQVFMLNQP